VVSTCRQKKDRSVIARATYTRGGTGKKDQASEVGSTLVTEGACCVDQGGNSIGLHSASNQRATPGRRSAGGLLRLDEVLLRVRGLSAVVCVSEDWGEDSQRSSVGEGGAGRDGRGLNRREI
jgi:hypothetical protein